jgi:uncharacterized protein
MDNPFRYGSAVSAPYFVGREQEMAELEMDMRSGQDVVIISPRRYGKTSLVRAVAERLRDQGILVAYLDLMTCPSKELLADRLATALYDGLVGFKDRAWHRVQEFFGGASLRTTVTIGPDGTPSVDLGAGERSRDTDAILSKLLELPRRIADDRGKKIVVVLDEFQEAPAIDSHLPALIRSVWQMQQDVSHVFLGSKRHMMERLFTHQNEPMYRMAKPMILDPIDSSVFAAYIRDRFAATEQQITDSAVGRILEITDSHPHDTQELASFAWGLAATEQTTATPELVDRALDRVLRAENSRYTEIWSRLTNHQRLVLGALVVSRGASGIYSESYRRQHRLGAPSSVSRSLKALLENDLVEEISPGEYRVPDTYLRAWLARVTATSTTLTPQTNDTITVAEMVSLEIEPTSK